MKPVIYSCECGGGVGGGGAPAAASATNPKKKKAKASAQAKVAAATAKKITTAPPKPLAEGYVMVQWKRPTPGNSTLWGVKSQVSYDGSKTGSFQMRRIDAESRKFKDRIIILGEKSEEAPPAKDAAPKEEAAPPTTQVESTAEA